MMTRKTTEKGISNEEHIYRESKKNELLLQLQRRFGKTREQVLALFRLYNRKGKHQ